VADADSVAFDTVSAEVAVLVPGLNVALAESVALLAVNAAVAVNVLAAPLWSKSPYVCPIITPGCNCVMIFIGSSGPLNGTNVPDALRVAFDTVSDDDPV
jgi:hypothetical protein